MSTTTLQLAKLIIRNIVAPVTKFRPCQAREGIMRFAIMIIRVKKAPFACGAKF